MDDLPYPESDGRTHHADCYRTKGHHSCAVMRVAELEAALRRISDGEVWTDTVTPRKVARAALEPAPSSNLEQIGTSLEHDALEPAPAKRKDGP